MSTKKTIKIGGKDISLTKDGFPNKRELTKFQREIVDKIRKEKKEQEIEKQDGKNYVLTKTY